MSHASLDRSALKMNPLSARKSKKVIAKDHIPLDFIPKNLSPDASALVADIARNVLASRATGRPVILAFGAHTIKNGLGPVLIELIRNGWVTHLATNGAGIIHDWEFAYQGLSSEDVRANVAVGQFGNWQETGFYLNLAINVGAYEGKGYGEAVGAFIHNECLMIPSAEQLVHEVESMLSTHPEQAAAAADLLGIVRKFNLPAGRMEVAHPSKQFSVQAAAYAAHVPSTDHPMIGHDIIYNHPMNHGGLLGRAALRDFLTYAGSINQLEGGVYLSLGSAVMSPMIFEKSLSMSRNLALQEGRRIENFEIMVVDLQPSHWDWSQGEPPETSPDYYLRYCKTFARMGGHMRYLSADNRDFLMALYHALKASATS